MSIYERGVKSFIREPRAIYCISRGKEGRRMKKQGVIEKIMMSSEKDTTKIIKLWVIARLHYKTNKGRDSRHAWNALMTLLTYDLTFVFGFISGTAERLAAKTMSREHEIEMLKEIVPELKGRKIR